jgi:hypothetical protein
MPIEIQHTEIKDGGCAYSGLSRLEQGISFAC